MASTCRFCDIADGDSDEESAVIFRNDHVVAFPAANQRPFSRGHVLVVPRAHVETLYDLTAPGHAPVLTGLAQVARAIRALPETRGVWMEQHNERAAFQSVDHAHFHLIPFRRRLDILRHALPAVFPVSLARRIRQANAVRAALEAHR